MSTDPVDVEVKQTSIQQSNCLLFAHISNFNLKVSQQLDNLRKFKIASETATRSQRIGEFFTDRLRCMLEKINFSEIPSIVRSLLYLMVFESWLMRYESWETPQKVICAKSSDFTRDQLKLVPWCDCGRTNSVRSLNWMRPLNKTSF